MLILFAVIPPVNAAGGWLVGQVIGKDMDNQDIPLEWANVTVYKDGVLVASVSPGFDGSYSMPLPSGLYVVSADHIGFNGSSQLVSIRDWYVTEADFRLDRAPQITGDIFDFSLSSTRLVNVLPGELGWARIQVTLCCGLPQTVSLSVSGLPANASASISPPSGRPSYASICLITTTAATPMGSYNVTVTGVGGGMSHNATFTLTIST
jgi:hypothetical protein